MKFILIVTMLCVNNNAVLIFNFLPAVKRRYETFQNITPNKKWFQYSSEKHSRDETTNNKNFTSSNKQFFLNL